ncbi:MAG TPA: DUF6443 domain-containing protein, partial [Prolixibacteraceae bacterium]|nr:DUF6443 domain-containing protein [Prolixibacteraceae bacterium]
MKKTFNNILFALGLLPFFAHGQIPPEVPLQSMVTVSDLTFYEHQSEYFTARDTIIVAGNGQNVTLNSGSSLTFTAGNSIILRPGFKAKSGSYAHAKIATGHQADTPGQINQNINNYQSLVSQPGKNYIRTYTYRNADPQYDSYAQHANIDIVYYDGLGRPIETVALKASPTGKDMVQMQTYDNYGRPYKNYMPMASNTTGGVFVPEQTVVAALPAFLNSNYDLSGSDANYGYSKPKYDDSPLNRIIKQGAPGADWQPESHPVSYDYQSNAEAVSSWRYDNNVKIDITYQPGSLFVEQSTDEDGKPSRTYTDKQGRLVMTEVDDGDQWLQTRYCYDGLGNLRCVMQPMASNPIDAEYCFLYEYNKRKQVIKKRTPGKGFEYFIYDARDRLALRADGNSLYTVPGSSNKWYYQKYDLLNRVTETGYIITPTSISDLTTYYETNTQLYPLYSSIHFQERFFYDDYPTIAPFSTTLKFVADDLATAALKTSNTKGLLVAKRGGIIEAAKDDGFSTAETFHYDKHGRVIQHVKLNHLNEVERVSTLYDFTGQPIKTRQIYNYGSANAFAVYMEYTRDHRGRLLKTVMKVSKNGTELIPATIVEANVYNEAGLLETRYLHSQNGSAFLQRIDYKYNIRGWLTKINDPLLSSGEGDRFGMALYYNRTPTAGPGYFNGNIYSIKWASHSTATNQQQNFVYDRANRLTQSRTTNMG